MEDRIENMRLLAEKWHQGQFRKGPERLPYIVHPVAVVEMLKAWGFSEARDPYIFCVAWGHDLVEDTEVDKKEIIAAAGGHAFGNLVYRGIKMLSKPEKVNKEVYIHDVATLAPRDLLVVKMADRLCNTRDFIKDGNSWGKTYLQLGMELFERLEDMPHADAIGKTLAEVKERVELLG
ncbi:MAG: hypothetical protein MJ240_09015 [Kiritimatiellae bacterium]|nr:hypothetical protein [Kiritimatiellia bacterium]